MALSTLAAFKKELQRQRDVLSTRVLYVVGPSNLPSQLPCISALIDRSSEYDKQVSSVQKILADHPNETILAEWDLWLINSPLAIDLAAYCEPSGFFVDPKHVLSRLKTLLSNRADQPVLTDPSYVGLWKDPALLKWLSSHGSSSLSLESPVSRTTLEIVAVELIDYLTDQKQAVVWNLTGFPNDVNGVKVCTNRQAFLQQIVIQILKLNVDTHSLGFVGKMIEQITKARDDKDWIEMIGTAVEGIPLLYLVLDLSILREPAVSRTSRSFVTTTWQRSFNGLMEVLAKRSPPTVLKLLYLGFPLQGLGRPDVAAINIDPPTFPQDPPLPWQEISQLGLSRTWKTIMTSNRSASTSPNTIPGIRRQRDNFGLFKANRADTFTPPQIGETAGSSGSNPRDWFQGMKSFAKCVDAGRRAPDGLTPRVKIAIFDTGLDLTHPDIAIGYQNGRITTYDFIEGTSRVKDLDGHGTHCVSLLLTNAPNAEIYVGRVFERSKTNEKGVTTLIKAIKHAVSVWKVDIISLSLGFTQSNDDLYEEIAKASTNTLIFAAAANNTTNEITPIRFPARMSEVMCIFSSNSHGRPSDFNPPAQYDRPNFTFPGENIEGAWPAAIPTPGKVMRNVSAYKCQDGTSCATPLAAAVAACILEYVWQERAHSIRGVRSLKRHKGLTTLFLKWMVDRYKPGSNDYHYVKPWMLISVYKLQSEIPILISNTMDNIDS